MIPGNKGPIIFPFKSIGQQVLTINRNQLVHHNSHIAILAAANIRSNVYKTNKEIGESRNSGCGSSSHKSSSPFCSTPPASVTDDSSSCKCSAKFNGCDMPVDPTLGEESGVLGIELTKLKDSGLLEEPEGECEPLALLVEQGDLENLTKLQESEDVQGCEKPGEHEETNGQIEFQEPQVLLGQCTALPSKVECKSEDSTSPMFQSPQISSICKSSHILQMLQSQPTSSMFQSSHSSEMSQDPNLAMLENLESEMNQCPQLEMDQCPKLEMNQCSKLEMSPDPQSKTAVSKLDVDEFLQWQWEKLVHQLDELDIEYPDGCSMSMSEFTDELTLVSPMAISELALHLYQRALDLCSPEWANRFIQLIGHRILTISKGQVFLELNPDTICAILSSDFLDVASERSVFRAANRWLDHDFQNRTPYTAYVLGCVRYGLMPKEDLIKYVVTRRRLKEGILAMPPFQRSLTQGLIWMAMGDLLLEGNFPEFAPTPRNHPGRHTRGWDTKPGNNCVKLPKGKGHFKGTTHRKGTNSSSTESSSSATDNNGKNYISKFKKPLRYK